MRIKTSVLVPCTLLILATALPGQLVPLNPFHVYSGSTSFSSRGFLAGSAGELLQGYPAEQFRGIGDAGSEKEGKLYAFGVVTQDQDNSTSEEFRVVFRTANNKGEPDTRPRGLIVRSGALNLPTGGASGPVVFGVTVNLGTEGVVVPGNGTFFAGIEVAANASWTSDGQSVHASAYTNPSSATGDPVRADAPNNAWQVDAAGTPSMVNPRTWNYTLFTQRGAFQVGVRQSAAGPGIYGSCGSYPDADTHGLAFRLRDAAMANRPAAVFMSTKLIGGKSLPFDGYFWIKPQHLVMVASGTLDNDGELELMPAAFAPGTLMALKGTGNLPFQAMVDFGFIPYNVRTFNAHAANF